MSNSSVYVAMYCFSYGHKDAGYDAVELCPTYKKVSGACSTLTGCTYIYGYKYTQIDVPPPKNVQQETDSSILCAFFPYLARPKPLIEPDNTCYCTALLLAEWAAGELNKKKEKTPKKAKAILAKHFVSQQ